MPNIPQDSDPRDLFSHLLEHEQTEEFKAEADAQRVRWRENQRPYIRTASHNYRKRHPDLVAMRAKAQKHKAKLYERQKGLCRWCGEPLDNDYEIDHIKPLISGGTNALRNLCVCHASCNRKKYTKTLEP